MPRLTRAQEKDFVICMVEADKVLLFELGVSLQYIIYVDQVH